MGVGPWLVLSREPHASSGAASSAGGWDARSARPTDHAARTTEVHVAAYHQVCLVGADDHDGKSQAVDAPSTNRNPMMWDACPSCEKALERRESRVDPRGHLWS